MEVPTRQASVIGWTTATVVAILSMVAGGITTFYATRDQSLQQVRAEIQAAEMQLRAEQREQLSHYVSREEWAQWKEQNRARQDSQYYDLLSSIQRIGARLAR